MPNTIRAQKKIASRLARPALVRNFFDEDTAQVMHALRTLTTLYCQRHGEDARKASKLEKYMLKIGVKLGVLEVNGRLNGQQDRDNLGAIMARFHDLLGVFHPAMQAGRLLDYGALVEQATRLKDSLKAILQGHCTQKSVDRLETVFEFYSRREFLDEILNPSTNVPYREPLDTLMHAVYGSSAPRFPNA